MAYQGNVAEILLSDLGLSGNKNNSKLRPGHLVEALNVSFTDGFLGKGRGAAKYNSTAISGNPTILGGHDWDFDGSTQRQIVYTSDGKLIKDDGAGSFSTELKTGLNTSAIPVFVEGGKETEAAARHLFIFNGVDAVQVLDDNGATTGDLATPPAAWTGSNQPSFGLIHEDRLWGAFGHTFNYSLATNHEDFTTGGEGTLAVYPGEGEKMVAGASYKGLIVVWKFPKGIYFVDATDPDISNWKVRRLTKEIGAAGPRCFTFLDDDIVFLSAQGTFHRLSAVQEFGNLGNRNLSAQSDMDPFVRGNIKISRMANAQLAYYEDKNEIIACLTSTNGSVNDRRIVIDRETLGVDKFRFDDRDENESIWIAKQGDGTTLPYVGDSDGFVWKLDQAALTKDGAGYSSSAQTPHDDLSFIDPRLAWKRKNFAFLELVFDPESNSDTVTVNVIIDGDLAKTLTFSLAESGTAALGSFVLGTNKLAGAPVDRQRLKIDASGHNISLQFVNSAASEDFKIQRAFLYFTVADERKVA